MKLSLVLLGLNAVQNAGIVSAAPLDSWSSRFGASSHAVDMFNTAIEWNDKYWDDEAGYLITSTSSRGRYDSRHTAWYAPQLLARNGPGDVEKAIRIFENVISGQYLDPSKQWYGNYQQAPSEPEPGTLKYPDDGPYSSWDPNIRDFVGCAWIVALNDYGHLLPAATVSKVERSLHIAAKGDLYRVGGVDGDNSYPCYSNPWLMRTILHNWVGARVGDANLTRSGETFAQEIYDLWSMHHTLSEFNSPTYAGVAMWALALWNQYGTSGSLLKTYGPEMLEYSWNELAELYNANLKNVAGPWDRSYGYDMKQYASLTGAVIWGVIGREHAPVPQQELGMFHQDDFAFYPLFALSMPEMVNSLPPKAKANLLEFPGEHMYTSQAYSPPFDVYPRNITAWMSKDVTIGAETVAETVVGGPAINPSQFNPAVIQWAIDDHKIGCISHWVTESSIHAVAAPRSLNISYPNATSAHGPVSFNFLFSGLTVNNGFNVTGLEGLPGLNLKISTNAQPNYTITYNTDHSVNEFVFYNITYTMPESFTGVPFVSLQVV
ncbi:hypothetical protein NUH16_001950 [Penicillium rubens]|uniref:Pc22g23380 protein n=1 Tax=Penicillium rubens (strain ATCC 28089 / DSM 1075 / NRRL 1951 / Wisconsin 54-1255) TaxID=500485 RepID=B6HVS5_PENRW|nr:uncharacterized protein N7525_004052 [Penicillium rubens]KAJ5045138.1 hypothetical protein NUH16_001950 [Penicillium rubens]KAJ5838864.1 hypothetical protein N7525_004052 [Penicillium rubens]KAJ5866914.1 hypothetical protein N7534_001467 [Penicillium rubens]CAP99626.1 Pc22g23380 [Penicillium rubens Wisconsin 54-1255]